MKVLDGEEWSSAWEDSICEHNIIVRLAVANVDGEQSGVDCR